jgi:PKD repeat protein
MEWDFELDGKIDSKEGPNVTKTYTIPGNYIAKLIVKDRYVSSSCSVPIR